MLYRYAFPLSLTSTESITMPNTPEKNLAPLPAGKYGISTNPATKRRHQANAGKTGLEAERVRALGALRNQRSKKRKAAEQMQETKFVSRAEKKRWIDEYVEKETEPFRRRVAEAEEAIRAAKHERPATDKTHSATETPKPTFEEMLRTIGDDLNDIDDEEGDLKGQGKNLDSEGEDEEDEDEEDGSDEDEGEDEDDDSHSVLGKMNETRLERVSNLLARRQFREQVTMPGWEEAEKFFKERDKKHNTANLVIPAIIDPRTKGGEHLTPTLMDSLCEARAQSEKPEQPRSLQSVGNDREMMRSEDQVYEITFLKFKLSANQ